MQTINVNGLTNEETEVIALSIKNGIYRGSLDNLNWSFESDVQENDDILHVVGLLEEGYTCGFEPTWSLNFDREVELEYLMEPFTDEEILKEKDENNYVSGVIAVPITNVIDADYEGFLDLISTKLVNSDCLMDIRYGVVGQTEDGDLLIEVSGDTSNLGYDFENEEDIEVSSQQNESKLVVLVRERPSENETYTDFCLVPKDEDAEEVLRKAIRTFLLTMEGNKEIKKSSEDFNWGDIYRIPNETWSQFGITMLEDNMAFATNEKTVVKVDQDEILIPDEYWTIGEKTV